MAGLASSAVISLNNEQIKASDGEIEALSGISIQVGVGFERK